MPKIVRQWESKGIRDGAIFTQWTDGAVTRHYKDDDLDRLLFVDHMPYIKEIDFEAYPERVKFHTIIARHGYNTTYAIALFERLIPPLPKPVVKAVQYNRRGKAGKIKPLGGDE